MARPKLNGPTPKFTLRLNLGVRDALAEMAKADSRTLGNYINSVLAEHVGLTPENNDQVKKRINVSIDTDLHEDAKVLARDHHKTDVSGLISQLIVADLERTGVGAIVKSSKAKDADTTSLSAEAKQALTHARSAAKKSSGAPRRKPQGALKRPNADRG